MLGQLAVAILTLSKTLPKLAALIDLIVEMRITQINQKSETEDEIKNNERIALINSMKNAKDDNERKVIARLLYRNYQH